MACCRCSGGCHSLRDGGCRSDPSEKEEASGRAYGNADSNARLCTVCYRSNSQVGGVATEDESTAACEGDATPLPNAPEASVDATEDAAGAVETSENDVSDASEDGASAPTDQA